MAVKKARECRLCHKMVTKYGKHQVRVELYSNSNRGIPLTYSGYFCPKCAEALKEGVPSVRNSRLVLVA